MCSLSAGISICPNERLKCRSTYKPVLNIASIYSKEHFAARVSNFSKSVQLHQYEPASAKKQNKVHKVDLSTLLSLYV